MVISGLLRLLRVAALLGLLRLLGGSLDRGLDPSRGNLGGRRSDGRSSVIILVVTLVITISRHGGGIQAALFGSLLEAIAVVLPDIEL